jgi:hypothetical protein
MRCFGLAGLVWAVLLLAAVPVRADQQSSPPANRTADFLFGRPSYAVGVRAGWLFASAGSDVFDFVTHHLTIDKADFNRPAFAADVAFALSSRVQVEAGVELVRMERGSEYRDLVDNNLLPIEQTTSLNTTHLVGGVRYALLPRGREISRLVWVPSKVVPYLGAGVGAVFWQFQQYGDFVDFVDNSVFSESFHAQGWAPAAQVFGGVDIQLHRGLYAAVQARYTKAAGELGPDFIDFEPIDLSGLRATAGINFVF